MAEPDWNRIIARKLAQVAPQAKSDGWQKASAVASIVSSVVIAAIVPYSIQRIQTSSAEAISRAQIEAAKAKNADDTRLQEAKIASDMLKEIFTSGAKHRAAVLVMIEPYLTKERYTQLCAALAREDMEPQVRLVALQQLGNVPDRKGLEVLRGVASDSSASAQDRVAAQRSAESVLSALDRVQFLRTLANPESPLQVKLKVDEGRIQLQNLSSVALFVVVLDIDSTGRIRVLFPDNALPYALQPNAIVTAAPSGAAVIRVIGSKSPIDPSNLDEPTLRKLNPADWCTQAHFSVQAVN